MSAARGSGAPEPPVLREIDARGVATLSLNRPAVNNAYDGALVECLRESLAAVRDDDAVRVVVVRGRGRHFQAGADLRWIREVSRQGEAGNRAVSQATAGAFAELAALPKPTVALVHGACYGGGTGLVASCDVAIASADATFAITEVRWGLIPGIIVPQLVAAIGAGAARRYALSGERFDASRAMAIGLVSEVCPSGGLDAAAAPLVDALLRSAPRALAATKRALLRQAHAVAAGEALDTLVNEHTAQRLDPEAREGLRSFDEKRDPDWYTG